MNCSRDIFTDAECSGHGVCNATISKSTVVYKCICEDGYTGESDYINMNAYGSDCHMNKTLSRVLWGILCLLSAVALLTAWKHSEKVRWRMKQKRTRKGPNYTLYFFIAVASCGGLTFTLSALKLAVGQEQLIGIHAFPTILFWLSRSFFYLMAFFMVRVMLQMSLGNRMISKDAGALKTAQAIFFYKLWLLDEFQCIFVFLPIFFDAGSSTVETLYIILNVFSALALLGTLVAVIMAQKSIDLAFKGTTDKKVMKLKKGLKGMVKDAVVALVINMPLFLSFGLMKKAWKFWGYFIPAQYCLVMVVLIKLSKVAGGRRKKKVGPNGETQMSTTTSSEGSSGDDN